ncbi:ISL3 family transposase [Dictyobacter formicarum]|uniref:Transposase n=1 Tax=Dictyobacter formicarum TaxID=2778368 RepID=A0ABQ3V8R6_9CHLR|nr:ISL3 family transposase [Dictyobacter formicarum]GHO82517.1 transposase [Dictyobacter formicarum]
MNQTDSSSPFLPLPDGMVIASVHAETNRIVVHIACSLPIALCPACGQPSERIHEAYGRTVVDLPCGGRPVILKLSVRKFVCRTATCSRRIFTERFSDLVLSYARMTNRLSETLQTLGFATCGELGERLAPKLGMRARACPEPSSVRILGIDDWSWKKGVTYGTILVDLDLHKPIELLPDRTASTSEAWLRRHPEVELVSRDRGGDYAAAAKKSAPQAQQVADRFHLLQNLRERLKEVMDRKQDCLPEVEERASDAIPAKARGIKGQGIHEVVKPQAEREPEKHYRTGSASPNKRPEGMRYDDFQKQVRRDKRIALYHDVRTLVEQGLSQRAIARKLDLARATVSKLAQAEEYPEMHPPQRGEKWSILNPYKSYILDRWQQGCTNGVQLYDEIKARGYPGSEALLRMFLADLRSKHREAGSASVLTLDGSRHTLEIPADLLPKPCIKRRISGTRASWLFVSQPEKLDEKQQKSVEQIRKAHPDLETAYQLGQAFVMMLAERRETDLDAWLIQAEHSNLPEFKKMAKGIHLDYAAVKAAFSSMWSQGPVEGAVNKIKMHKRLMYGRAHFKLLRLKMLHQKVS